MKNKILLVSVIVGLVGCAQLKKEGPIIPLPFYNQADFTPEWIEKNVPGYNDIHTIEPFNFIDQNGDSISNDSFQGKIYVANFFFTTCPGICPRMTTNLMAVQNAFATDSTIKILSHTVMPWADSVAQLKDYEQARGINGAMWHLVTGTKEDLYTIARGSYFADEGFGKSVTIESDFLHTENLVLVDAKQRIRGVYNGTIPLEVQRLIDDIKTLQAVID